jgi:hypothetical protein
LTFARGEEGKRRVEEERRQEANRKQEEGRPGKEQRTRRTGEGRWGKARHKESKRGKR